MNTRFAILSPLAALALGVLPTSCTTYTIAHPQDPNLEVATCSVQRIECESRAQPVGGASACSVIGLQTFTATTCYNITEKNETQACQDMYCSPPYYTGTADEQTDCKRTMVASKRFPAIAECGVVLDDTFGDTASVNCLRGGRACTVAGGAFCTRLDVLSESDTRCFNSRLTTGFNVCLNNSMSSSSSVGTLTDLRVNIPVGGVKTSCPTTATKGAISLGLGTSSFSAAMQGSTTAITAKAGFATMDWGCDDFEQCHPLSISTMRLMMNDATIKGVLFKNTVIDLLEPVSIIAGGPFPVIKGKSMKLKVTTTGPIGTTEVVTSPDSDLTVDFTPATSLKFSGSFGALLPGTGNTVVPVTVTANVSATTTSPGSQCSGFTPTQEVLGFENTNAWTTTPPVLSTNPTRHTQGCFGMSVGGSNFRTLIGSGFPRPVSGGKARVLLDVYVPPNQPNPSWQGAVQANITCKSSGINNVFIGQAELTGKPTNAFTTVTYNVPSNVQAALAQSGSACYFTIGVNSNATPTPIVLDNLRFSF